VICERDVIGERGPTTEVIEGGRCTRGPDFEEGVRNPRQILTVQYADGSIKEIEVPIDLIILDDKWPSKQVFIGTPAGN
jgi:hypothetical protein